MARSSRPRSLPSDMAKGEGKQRARGNRRPRSPVADRGRRRGVGFIPNDIGSDEYIIGAGFP